MERGFTRSEATSERLAVDRDLRVVGLRLEELKDKRTLEIGSGKGIIGKEAAKLGYNVVSLDLDPFAPYALDRITEKMDYDDYAYLEPSERNKIYENAEREIRGEGLVDTPQTVQGDARSMPFQDNSFDLAYSTYGPSVMYRLSLDTDGLRVLQEVERVLKPGAEYRFGPADPSERYEVPGYEGRIINTNLGYYSFIK